MVAAERAVLIRYNRDGPRRGSGLRVGGRMVLTADHCANGTSHRVIVDGQEYEARVHVRSGNSDADLAVLEAPDLPSLPPLGCAVVDRDRAAYLENCQALGFPVWKGQTGSPLLAQVRGDVPTAEGRDPAGLAVEWLAFKIKDPEAKGPPVGHGVMEGTPWAGMSGAVVVTSDDLVIGVVRSHALAEGPRSLSVTPLETITQLPAGTAALLWQSLGVEQPAALPRLPVSVETAEVISHSKTTYGEVMPSVAFMPALDPGMVRRADLETLIRHLELPSEGAGQRCIAVCGPGGFGKTTLVLQACHDPRVRRAFDDVLWVETGEQCMPDRIVQLISDLCVHLDGVRPALTDPEQAGFHLARVLGERRAHSQARPARILIVIDNVWSAADAAPFLLGGPFCVRIITTRNMRVCPPETQPIRVGPMSETEIREMFLRALSPLTPHEAGRLGHACQGWPLLAAVVGASVGQDIAAGVSPAHAVSVADNALRAHGPQAFDVWDADQRTNAIGRAINSSLRNLEERVAIGGASALRKRYMSLAIFPAATPIPLSVLFRWWNRAYGWNESAVRQFCHTLADRSLISAYMGDRDAIMLHDVFRSYLRHPLGVRWSKLHRELLDAHRLPNNRWSLLEPEHDYMWRHVPYHLVEAGLDHELVNTLADPDYIVTKVILLGHQSLVVDEHALRRSRTVEDVKQSRNSVRRVASALTGAGYLLHGLTTAHDVAATLMAALMRSADAKTVEDRLRVLANSAPGGGIIVRWVNLTLPVRHAESPHVGAVTTVAIHGDLIVSGGEDGMVRFWSLHTGKLVRTCLGHTGWVYSVAFSADGEIVASAGDDGMIRLWAARTGEPAGVFTAHTARVRALAFADVGRVLASGAEDGRVLLWDVELLEQRGELESPGCAVWSVAIDSTSSLVAVGGEDAFVRLYDMNTGRLLSRAVGHSDWVRTLQFAPIEAMLASGSGDMTLRIWQVTLGALTTSLVAQAKTRVRCVAWIDAEVVVTAGEDAILRTHPACPTHESVDTLDEQPLPVGVDWVRSLAVTSDGNVVAGCEDGGLRVWHRSTTSELSVLSAGSNTVWSTAFADGGRLALSGWGDGVIEIRETASTIVRRTVQAGAGRVWSLTAGGEYFGAACGDGAVRVWSVRGNELLLCLNKRERRSWAVAIDHSGRRIAASADGGRIMVWELPSGRMLWTRAAHTGRIRSMSFDNSGDRLLTGGGEGSVRLWDAAGGGALGRAINPGGWVRTVAINDAGDRAVVGSGPGTVHVFDLPTGMPMARLVGHRGRVLALGLTPDSDHLVSAAADGTVRVWALPRQRQLAEVRVDASLLCGAIDARVGSALVASASGVVGLDVSWRSTNER